MHSIVGIKMSHRNEIIAIYKNDVITNTNGGVTFTYNEVVAMRVDKEITMERLKEAIAWKLQLSLHQFIFNLLYRHLISLCLTQY